ncbi:MAG: protein arginine kinase [Clostridiales bacterium]|jgi:protein arginine kinase|nr:protein arginine kinase [Clostridiales bacterium]
MKAWYTDEIVDATPVISSRVRLARNIKKYPFLSVISPEQSKTLVEEAEAALGGHFAPVPLAEKNDIEKRRLLERHIVSPEFLKINKPKGLMLQSDERICVMVNEEDHIRIQTIAPGDGIDTAWDTADKVDDLLEESVQYAFDKDYGYLTSCPTNTGTGLRASFMIHLPMTERTGNIRGLLPAVSKFGMTLRGIYGEGTEPLGHVYQVSNQVTLGKSEENIISGLKTITAQIIENENKLREKAMAAARIEMEDQFFRAYGTLTHARKLSAKEAMELLSAVRLGFLTRTLEVPKPDKTLYEIMMSIQPGSLQAAAGRELGENERDIFRASYLRDMFNK